MGNTNISTYVVAGVAEGEGDLPPVEVEANSPETAAFLMGVVYAMSWYDMVGFLMETQDDLLKRIREQVTITVN
jgi:hypothetical protein